MAQVTNSRNPPSNGVAGPPSGHLKGLDALRGIAVMLVIGYHLGLAGVPGGYGVVLFFVLSGFLITHLLLAERQRYGRISLRQFYLRRSLRIFPAFYVYWLTLVAALLLARRTVPWGHAWSAFFYFSDYYNAILGDPNTGFSHTWSLAIEEQFYLLWPLTLLAVGRRPDRLLRLLVAAIVGIWVYRWGLHFIFHAPQAYLYAAFDTRADALLVGCLLAVARDRRIPQSLVQATIRHPLLPLVTVGLIVLVIMPDMYLGPTWRDLVGHAVTPPLFAVLILQLVAVGASPYWAWLERPSVRFFGKISYSLYLWQQLTVPVGMRIGQRFSGGLQFLVAVLLTVLVASLSYYAVEGPFLRLKERFGYRRIDSRIPGSELGDGEGSLGLGSSSKETIGDMPAL